MQQNVIRWDYISKALSFYYDIGYDPIEVSWYASEEAVNVTIPPHINPIKTQDGILVGSAEQSFIDLMLNKKMYGKYVAVTPCFRDDVVDHTHKRTFMKVELFDASPRADFNSPQDIIKNVKKTANIALSFFQTLEGGAFSVLKPTHEGYDITLNGVEIGSYGHRSYKDLNWIYGTGFADPRFSIAKNINR